MVAGAAGLVGQRLRRGALAGSEYLVPSALVFEIVGKSWLSAYDCEFVALASVLAVPLVTTDNDVLEAFPEQALTMAALLKAEGGTTRGGP